MLRGMKTSILLLWSLLPLTSLAQLQLQKGDTIAYIGQVVARGGFERTDIDTVSFGFLMDAVDSVRHDGQLFEEVCRYNPYCHEVIERFDRSDRRVRDEMLSLQPQGRDSDEQGGEH